MRPKIADLDKVGGEPLARLGRMLHEFGEEIRRTQPERDRRIAEVVQSMKAALKPKD